MLSTNQNRALAALLTNPTREAAARACGLSVRTVFDYEHKCPEFAKALQEGRSQALQEAAHSLAACYPSSVKTLRDIVDNDTVPAQARVAAARALFEYGLRFQESAEFDKRLRDLEGLVTDES